MAKVGTAGFFIPYKKRLERVAFFLLQPPLQRVGNCVPGLPFEIGNGRFCNFQLGKSSLQLFFQIDNQLGGITLRFLEYRFEEADAIRRYNGEGDGSNIHDEQNVQQNTNFPRHRNAKN